MPITRVGDWKLAKRLLSGGRRIHQAIEKATMQEAQFLRAEMVKGIREQAPGGKAFEPLSEMTLLMREFLGFSGTKALIVRGDLRNSIAVLRVGERVFVGVLKSARGKGGQLLVDVARIMEEGAGPFMVRFTEKQKKFLAMAFQSLNESKDPPGRDQSGRFKKSPRKRYTGDGMGLAIVTIKARPFMKPVIEKYTSDRQEVAKRFLGRVARLLGFEYGQP